MNKKNIALIVFIFLSPFTQAAEVYRYTDSNGRTAFSDKRQHDGYVPLIETTQGWEELRAPESIEEGVEKYSVFVQTSAKRHGVPADLVNAVIHAESHFNPVAESPKGAVGLMQLMPATARRFEVDNSQDPKQNIDAGVRYLAELMDMFDHNVQRALAAYNAGENAVLEQGNRIPPSPETKKYVHHVLFLRSKYKSDQYIVHVPDEIILEPRVRNLQAGL